MHCNVDSTRIWNSNLFPGMIRLLGGNYSNEGRIEVYCNGQWGQYAIMDLILLMHLLSVNNWDIPVIQIIIIFLVCLVQ